MTTAVTTQEPEVKGIRALLRATTERWAPFVPKGVDPEAVVQAAYLETKRLPALLRCEPESILQAVTRVQQLGLAIGVTAYLLPFKDKNSQKTICTVVIGKDGVVELITGTGVVRHVQARCIYANEPYSFVTGTVTTVEHRPISDPTARGAMLGAYAVFKMRGGDVQAFEMSLREIDAIRRKFSKQWKDGDCPDWYAEKTVIIHGSKHLPKNAKLASVHAAIDGEFADLDATPAAPARATVTHAPPRPLAQVDGYEERAKVITAGPVSEAHLDEANRVLAEHGQSAYQEGGFEPPY